MKYAITLLTKHPVFSKPKTQMIIILSLIYATSIIHYHSFSYINTLTLFLVSTVFCDFLLLKIRRIKLSFTSSSVVTGIILALVSSPTLSWYEILSVGAASMFSKNFIRINNRHIFNPGAFGLLAGSILFRLPVSWWSVSFQQLKVNNIQLLLFTAILLLPLYVSAVRFRKYRIQISFFLIYLINLFFTSANHFSNTILNGIFDPTTMFFTAVMLPEPMTTPKRPVKQIIFGLFVGIFAISFSLPITNFILSIAKISLDPYIISLLIANLVFFLIPS